MNSIFHKNQSSAKVVDGSLVLSLPEAITPVVMRLSLEEVKSASFEVSEKDGQYILLVKVSQQDHRPIAPFASREQAVDALMATSEALEKGARQTMQQGSQSNQTSLGTGGLFKWTAALALLILVVWFIFSTGTYTPRPLENPANQAADNVSGSFGTTGNETGVPLPADAFLGQRAPK